MPPPLSAYIAQDRGAYLSGLTLYRQGSIDPWVNWVAEVLERSANAMVDLVEAVEAEVGRQESGLKGLRADSTARRIVALLPEIPVISAPTVAARLGVSVQAARTSLLALEQRGVIEAVELRPARLGRPAGWWQARWVLDIVGRWAV